MLLIISIAVIFLISVLAWWFIKRNKKDPLDPSDVKLIASEKSIILNNRQDSVHSTQKRIDYIATITGKSQDELKEVKLVGSLPISTMPRKNAADIYLDDEEIKLKAEYPIYDGNKTTYKWTRLYRFHGWEDVFGVDKNDKVTLTVIDNENNKITKTVDLTIKYEKAT